MREKKLFLSSPTMHDKEMGFIQEAFDTNWVAPLGENVTKFEEELASYVGAGFGAALSSGTDAIFLALKLLGVQRGDIVFTTDLTFAATCNPIMYLGAVPVFLDSEEESWNMDPKVLRKAFDKYPKAKAVIVVNLYGTPAKLEEIRNICQEHHTPLIEDGAESLGAIYKGKQTGTFGDIGIFSFNGNKIITSSGGGMLVSDKEEYTKKAVFLATQAREPERHYEHKEVGYNFRMSNIVAGIGRGQLCYLDEHIQRKKGIYERYKQAFDSIWEIEMNPYLKDSKPNFWLSCMTIKEGCNVKPIDIMLALEEKNIESRPIWKPMHLQPVYKNKDFIKVTEKESIGGDIFCRGLCLPSDIKNTEEDMEEIIGVIKGFFS